MARITSKLLSLVFSFGLALVLFLNVPSARAQAGLSTGTIQGTITDPQSAVVPNATVLITNRGTGAKVAPSVSSSGEFNSGPLAPGEYLVRVEAKGFKTAEHAVVVQVGNITQASVKLEIGSEATVLQVEGTAVSVNTEQTTIQGVVTSQQIENLPINGRNFLDLAQLEPGVQIQDGGNFDPTKKGFSSISFGGRFGRTARIEVDGLDISDETVGTTTQNIGVNSIKEFQVSQSNLDIATELTSSGTVNITTQSGTNTIHGEGFYNFRDDGTSASIGNPGAVFTRKQYGVNLGGPIVKDKLFAFGSWERTTQDLLASVNLPDPFAALSSSFNAPFRDQMFLGRLDYNMPHGVRLFGKYTFEQNKNVATWIPGTYQAFANVDHTPGVAVGADFTTGSFTHQIRFGYFKFRNGIVDASSGAGIVNPAPALALAIGNVSTTCLSPGDLFCSGPNLLAPQATYQTNKQIKYDGSKIYRSHLLRYGMSYNKILGGGFASFDGLAPSVRGAFDSASIAFASTDPYGPGGASNPLNYPVRRIFLGNGQGCFTEIPQFGQDCGGQFDSRFQWYIGDNWKVKRNITFMYGLRYNRDTGRADSDLQAITELNAFQAGLGNSIRQPNKNFGGTVGLAWDPSGKGKMVIRAGGGIYYENAIFNNVLFDRPGRLAKGLFNQIQTGVCQSGQVILPNGTTVTSIDGYSIAGEICNGLAVGTVQTAIADLQTLFQQTTVTAGPQANGAYFAVDNTTANTGSMFGPDYRSPYSLQMNIGIQRELKPGTVLSVDYVRNVGLHTLLGIDFNHVGDAKNLNQIAALSAISATNAFYGCAGTTSAAIDCAIAAGATLSDYVNDVSGSGYSLGGGLNATGGYPENYSYNGLAFGGIKPDYGQILLMEPIGRSIYNGVDVVLKSQLKSPVKFINNMNAQVAYSLSRFKSQAQDGDFVNSALDYNNPGKFIGPGSLDRTHQLSAGIIMELAKGVRANFIAHWYSALPQTILFNAPGNAEDIFQYDTTGDGQTGVAPVPGSNVGSFGRDIKAGDLNAFLQSYSSNYGNQLTPAGQALVTAGLFTQTQLQQLCAITPSLTPINNCGSVYPELQLIQAPAGQVGNDAFFTLDARLGWSVKPLRSWERLRIEPQVAFYNLLNRHNYNGPDTILNGLLDGSPGSINGTTKANRAPMQIGLGSGVFALGAPRAIEFGFKVNF